MFLKDLACSYEDSLKGAWGGVKSGRPVRRQLQLCREETVGG